MGLQQFTGTAESMAAGLEASVTLSDGQSMPWLGLGVYQMGTDRETELAVRAALDLGYRHVDTAAFYDNEMGVGAAVKKAPMGRESVFVTTKIWNDAIRQRQVAEAFEESMARLDLEYLDLLLLHWPVDGLVEGWEALLKLQQSGRVRSIGVSNFLVDHLAQLESAGLPAPTVNQIEFHPYLQSPELSAVCVAKGIQLTAWSPLMQGEILNDPVLQELAEAHGKTPAQIVLRWSLQRGVASIPKSSRPHRMEENASIFDFELSEETMTRLSGLDAGRRCGPDPANFGF